MSLTKDGFYKQIGSAIGNDNYLLKAGGGHIGLHTGRNNEANKVVRTDINGHIQAGWINTTSGDMETNAIDRVYCSNDEYIRYKTKENFANELRDSGYLDGRYLPLAGGWMDTDAQIYFKGAGSSTSVYGSIGYRDSFNGKMHLGGDTHNTKALYVCSNGYNAANDSGGIAIDNDGVTAFGAGDTGSVFRVLNEDNVSDGAQFAVTKDSGASVKRWLHINTQNSGTDNGITFYGSDANYSIMCRNTSQLGTFGDVSADWAMYFNMNNNQTRGWIFRRWGSANVFSISARGYAYGSKMWLSYNSNISPAYSWTDAALVTPTIEVLNYQGTVDDRFPTITLHHYGYGGPRLGSRRGILYIYGGNTDAKTLGSRNSYFSQFRIYPNEFDGLYVNDIKVLLGYRRSNLNISSTDSGMIAPDILGFKNGYPLYTDPEFASGNNSISVYNNSGGSAVTITREASTTSGNSSGYCLHIHSAASGASPYGGGFYFGTSGARGKVYVCIFRAYIPSGYSVVFHTNSIGSGGNSGWLTSQTGTGKYEWYAYMVEWGTASLSSTFFFTLNAAANVDWYLSYANVIDITKGNYDGLRTRYSDEATYLRDRTNGTATYSNYGGVGLGWGSITWLTCWNGYELRAISKGEMGNTTIVNQNTSSNTDYPLVWSNRQTTTNDQGNQLYKSYDYLLYNPYTKVLRNDGPLWLRPDRDATLKIYSGKITDAYSDGFICMQTSIDGTDGQSHSYPGSYQGRCVIALQPRGGEVYVGKTITAASTSADTTYKLNVGGHGNFDGNIWARGSGVYLRIGPQNGTYAHYETNASTSHWFNKSIDVNGNIWVYNTNYGITSGGAFHAYIVYANRSGSSTAGGVSLYSTSDPITEYGIAFRGTGSYDKLGRVQGDWATYLTMDSSYNRGWIFRSGGTNYASISARGEAYYSSTGRDYYIVYPNGGQSVGNGSSVTGAIAIYLPTAAFKCSTMLKFTVEIYEYSGSCSTTYTIAGYNYSDSQWYSTTAYSLRQGTNGKGNLRVRFGDDGSTRNIIWIGETNTTWSYPQVYIKDVTLGHSSYDYNRWAAGWSIGFVTSFGNVRTYIDNPAVNYHANNADYATYPNNVLVQQHTANNVDYPLIWSNQNNTSSNWGQQLHKSYAELVYNPANKEIKTWSFAPQGENTNRGIHFPGGAWINSIGTSVIFRNATIRFGGSGWDWNAWAGLNFDGNTTINIGMPNNSHWTANSNKTAGTIRTVSSKIEIYPDGNSNYGEGLRIHTASNGWTTLMFAGSDNTGFNGTSANSWSLHTNGGNFYLNKNNSSTATVNRIWGRSGGGFTIGNIDWSSYTLEVADVLRVQNGIVLGGYATFGTHYITGAGGRIYFGGNFHIDGYGRAANYHIYLNHYVNTNVYMVTGGGSVGIGTASPVQKLHVEGSEYINGNLYINTGDTDKFIQFSYNNNYYAGASWRLLSRGSGSGDTNYFDIETGGSNSSANTWYRVIRLTMDNRYVGIGTDSPSQKLHVSGGLVAVTNNGYTLTMGNQNGGWTHITTSGTHFWFNPSVCVDGNVYPYYTNNNWCGTTSNYWYRVCTAGVVHPGVWSPSYVFTTDGGYAYIGSMNVNSATKLTTENVGNSISPVYFANGIPVINSMYRIQYDGSSDWASYKYHRVMYINSPGPYADRWIRFAVTSGETSGRVGELYVRYRTGGAGTYESYDLNWLYRNSDINLEHFKLLYTNTSSSSSTAELWVEIPGQWCGYSFRVIDSGSSRGNDGVLGWVLCDSNTGHGSSSLPSCTGSFNSYDGTSGGKYWANLSVQTSPSSDTSPTFYHAYLKYYLYMMDSGGNFRAAIDRSGNSPIFGYGFGQAGYHVYYTGYTVSINANTAWSSTGNGIYINSSNNVGIGRTDPGYKLDISGDSRTTGWCRAGSGFYCEGNGVHYTHLGTYGEIYLSSNNVFNFTTGSWSTLYFNYGGSGKVGGTWVSNYVWHAGSTSTYADHNIGKLHVRPTSGDYSWNEGIRIHAASNGWTTLTLCGTDNTGDTGTSANTWSLHANGGNFYLSKNGSTGGTAYMDNISNKWYFNTTSGGEVVNVGGWINTAGPYGWYNSTYGGGIWMYDSTYVRVYNGKYLYGTYFYTDIGEDASSISRVYCSQDRYIRAMNIGTFKGLFDDRFYRQYNTTNLNPNYGNTDLYRGYGTGMSTQSGITGNWFHIWSSGWSDNLNWISQIAVPTADGWASQSMYYRTIQGSNYAWRRVLDQRNYKAVYGTTGSTSYIKIKINSTTSWMLSFTVRVYQSYSQYDLVFSGYNYGGSYWYSPQVRMSSGTAGAVTCYFGYDSAWNLWVGFPGASYTGVEIIDCCNGYSQTGMLNGDLFTISNVSSLSTIQSTQTAYQPWSMQNKPYWANVQVSDTSSTSTWPTFGSAYSNSWWRSYGNTGWYNESYGGGIYMTDTTWVRTYNSKGMVASCFYATNWSSENYLLRSDGGAAAFIWDGKSGQPTWLWGGNSRHTYYVYNPSNFSVNYANYAGYAHKLDIYGTIDWGLSFYQTDNSYMNSSTGWAHYIISNHGDGGTYYNYTIRLPFWSTPQYQRMMGNTSSYSGWHDFITDENYTNYCDSRYVKKSGDTMTGQLYINFDQDVGLNQNGSLIIGTKSSTNLAFDANEIMARNNSSASILYLNAEGGTVCINETGGYTGIGTNSPSYKLHVKGDIYANGGWLRTSGSAGWYSESYGGGWYMDNTTWLKNYNNKPLYMYTSTGNSDATPIARFVKNWDCGNRAQYDTVVISSNDCTGLRLIEQDATCTGICAGDGWSTFTANYNMRFYVDGSNTGTIYNGMGGTLTMRLFPGYVEASEGLQIGTDQLVSNVNRCNSFKIVPKHYSGSNIIDLTSYTLRVPGHISAWWPSSGANVLWLPAPKDDLEGSIIYFQSRPNGGNLLISVRNTSYSTTSWSTIYNDKGTYCNTTEYMMWSGGSTARWLEWDGGECDDMRLFICIYDYRLTRYFWKEGYLSN